MPGRRSLVIPAYNEADRIGATIERLARSKLADEQFELIVVDDGSTDRTREVVAEAAERVAIDVVLVPLPTNSGKGCAVQAGIRAAGGQVVAFSDADLSADEHEIERVFVAVEQGRATVVAAARTLAGSVIVVAPPWRRRIAGRAFNLLIRGLGLLDVDDTQCGLKAFTADAAAEIFADDLMAARFAFDVEILVRADRAGHEILELPVRWSHDRGTTVNLVRDAPAMIADLVRLRRRYGRQRR